MDHCFASIFDNSKENSGQVFSITFASRHRRLYDSYNYAMRRPAPVVESWPWARLQVLQNSLDVDVQSLNPVSARLPLMKSKEEKIIESRRSNIKTRGQPECTDGVSAMQNGRGAARSFSTLWELKLCRRTHCDSP